MQKPPSSSRQQRDERRRERRRQDRRSAEFWQALYPERRRSERRAEPGRAGADTVAPATAGQLPPDDDSALDEQAPTAGDEQRREALLSMLATAESRHAQAMRRRRPALAAGVRVRVISGPFVGDRGQVLDADYIHARVRVELTEERVPQWVDFDQVVAQQDDGAGG